MRRPLALDRAALRSAVRLALVAMVVFAIGEAVLDNLNVALFGFFGCFALLMFAQFAGPAGPRLRAYAALAAIGFPLLALGTLCSRNPWLAAATMAVVAFAILFAGVVNGYLAAGANSALLLFVLPLMIPAPASQIPDRLAGWALACALAIPTAFLLWPDRPQGELRRRIAAACRALAACLELEPGADSALVSERAEAALTSVREAHRKFTATPYRPTGATGPTAAVAHLVNDVAWIAPLVMAPPPVNRSVFPSEAAEVRSASLQVLHASASLLEGRSERPDLERLERAREAVGQAFGRRLTGDAAEDGDLATAFDEAFRTRFLAYAVSELGAKALLAGDPAGDRRRLDVVGRLLASYANFQAVWFRSSLRGAVALGVAVLVAQLADVQHGFWAVLGTLSVLRSNALNTGSTILRAVAGTVLGIAIGGAIIHAIGSDSALLWAILPLMLVVAGYAPRAISFLAGQAAFTIVVLALFDLIEPSGWQTGLIRLEDIAIGCAISLGVGLLFWPRGAAGVVRQAVAAAYARTADHLAGNVTAMLRRGTADADDPSAREAMGACLRLDDAFRQYLAERSTARLDLDSLGSVVAGTTRVLRVGQAQRSAHALFRIGRDGESADLAGPRRTLEGESEQLRSWYHALGDSVAGAGAPPKPLPAGVPTEEQVIEWVRTAPPGTRREELSVGLAMAWEDRLLDTLRAVQPRLTEAAAGLGVADRM